MTTSEVKFCTAINCMDGRVQAPVNDFLRHKFKTRYVDVITEPGPNRIIARNSEPQALQSIIKRLTISLQCHHSVAVAVAGHHDCAGNPGRYEQQVADTVAAVTWLRSQVEALRSIPVIGLWIDAQGKVEEIAVPE